ncbi:MAG: DUF72 domain-containing protein [bacterium]
MKMTLFVGTSGYSYKEWRGTFYPESLGDKEMLKYYGQRLPAVEINNTFYRLPNTQMLQTWANQVPDSFRFVLKASRKITHMKALKDKAKETSYLVETSKTLGARLGAILFQLPPYLRKDLELLSSFLAILPDDVRTAFEFRHRSWLDEAVYDLLRSKGCALCCSDAENEELSQLVQTANWGYLRLRQKQYADEDLQTWADRIGLQNWEQVYVFFKHEAEATGPKLAQRFIVIAHHD